MRQLYSFCMYLLAPYVLVRLWWKGRYLPAYRQRIAERFFLDNAVHEPVDVWIHAVSLGEVIAVAPLIDALLTKGWRVLITTMTPTGAECVHNRFGNKVMHRYAPYDLSWVVRQFFKRIKPRLGLIVETELWPNLIHYASKMKIPFFLINARLSESSFEGYKKMSFLFKPLLNQFRAIYAQSEEDAKRFKALGAHDARVAVLGNMKFDLQTQHIDPQVFLDLKQSWGSQRPIVILASTHDNEEQQLLTRLRQLQAGLPEVLLLIAPRHPERFQKVYQLSTEYGFNTGLRSRMKTLNAHNDVVVLDSLGELLGFYQISDYAFVGGSLVPIGGHNVLEPISMRIPVLSGMHVHNFKTICRDLQEAQAIELVQDADHLIDKIIGLHNNSDKKSNLVHKASLVLDAHKGTVERYMRQITVLLERESA